MFHPPMQRPANRYFGKYSGEVVDNHDPEDLGRIQVRVPSMFGQDLAVRARPCLPYGYFFIPPPGTKVWVEFEAGDPQYPLWVGTWYPTGTVPREAAVSPPDNRILHTPSGHSLELRDEQGGEEVVLRHRGNVALRIAPDGTVTVTSGNGATLTLSGDTATVEARAISLAGTTVDVGQGASEPTLLGNSFKSLWDMFILHTHGTAVGPSGPPLPAMGPLQPGVHLTTHARVK